MKQIVALLTPPPIVQVAASEASESKFYGVELFLKHRPVPTCTGRALLTRSSYWKVGDGNGEHYMLLSSHLFTRGNGWDKQIEGASTFQQVIKKLLDGGHKIFEFDKLSELALWVEAGPLG